MEQNKIEFYTVDLPGSKVFEIEAEFNHGSELELIYDRAMGKNIYGMQHLIEHLSFKSTKDYGTDELDEKMRSIGTHNASTDLNAVNYWHRTYGSNNIKESINMVFNVFSNTLDQVTEEEFTSEKEVVLNELRRYNDTPLTMFHLDTYKNIYGIESAHNIIGDIENVNTFTLKDCINIKEFMLEIAAKHGFTINLTYDSEQNNLTDIKDLILEKFNTLPVRHLPINIIMNMLHTYKDTLKLSKHVEVSSEAKQKLVKIVMEPGENIFTTMQVLNYLNTYSGKTSLRSYIRENEGLTYGTSFSMYRLGHTDIISFFCDVESKNYDKLISLFKQSIIDTTTAFTKDKHDEFMKSKIVREGLSNLSLLNKQKWAYYNKYYSKLLPNNMSPDQYERFVNKKYLTYNNMLKEMARIKDFVERDEFSVLTTK